jgi:hypothetical protein
MSFRGYILLCIKQLFMSRQALICSLYRESFAAKASGRGADVSYEEARRALYAPAAGMPALAEVEIDQLEKAGVFLARMLAAWGLLCTVLVPVAMAIVFCEVDLARTGRPSGSALHLIATAAFGYGLGFVLGLLLLAKLSWPVSAGFRSLAAWRFGVPIVDASPGVGDTSQEPGTSLRAEAKSMDEPSDSV